MTLEEWNALWLSMKVALGCVAVLAAPGILLGWLLARKQFVGKHLLSGLIHIPLVIPPVVTGYLLLLLFGANGFLGQWLRGAFGLSLAFTWKAAVLASAVVALPLMVRSVAIAVELVDRRLEDSARTLGASPLHVLLTVTLPLAAPGILSGLALAFARSLGEFGATIMFAGSIEGETRTLPLAIYAAIQSAGGDMAAFRLVGISVLLSATAMAASELLARHARRRLGAT
jgi:molybdate transport system permease protein